MTAKSAYYTLIDALDNELHYRYDRDDGEMSVRFSVTGDDLKMPIRIHIDEKRSLVILYSQLPFEVPSSKLVTMARATGQANWNLADGSFDLNMDKGTIVFRATTSFRSTDLSPKAVARMLGLAFNGIDKYNELFAAIANGSMSLSTFFAKIGG